MFFPSYGYMELVYSEFSVMYPEVATAVQTKEMTNEERIDFLNLFCENTEKTLVGFVLCGGVFSEGVDLTGERLSGAVIVGTGLPQVCFERDLLKKHFDDIVGEGMGYNYAYTYTGLNRVYQAAGRVIRTAKDVGFVVLADDRFAKMSHRKTFPESWDNIKYVSDENMLNSELVSFWNKQKN